MKRRDDVLFTAASALGAMVLLLVLMGCEPDQGTDTGNALTVEFAVRGDTTAPQARELGTLTSATMLLNTIEYYDCASAGEVDFTGEFENDLLARTVLGTREVEFDAVCGVEMEAENPAGDTIVATGTTPLGTLFDFSTTMGIEAEIETDDPAGFPLVDGRLTRIDIVFDLDAWFDVDLDAGVITGDTILISADDNADLHAAIEERILADGALERED